MDLKNTQEVDVAVIGKNAQSGPASGLTGAWTANPVGNAFTWHPAPGGGNLSGTLKGNPQSTGTGTLDFAGSLPNGDPVVYSVQVNITASDATQTELIIGTPREQ